MNLDAIIMSPKMVISLEYNPVETWMDTMSATGTISFLERESIIEKIKFKLNYDYDEVIGALGTLEFYDSISNIFFGGKSIL